MIQGREELTGELLIGVDFGGTKILTGAMTADGEVVCDPVKLPTNGGDAPEKIIGRVTASIDEVLAKTGAEREDVAGIGMGVTGPIDIRNGRILECPQLPTLHFYPLKKMIEERYGRPVHMNNDANCLIYGETLFGSGVGMKNVVGFTLGTGVGCAIIIDGNIFVGNTESAGEIWPSPYRDGTIEDLVSGSGVSKIYRRITGCDKTARDISVLAEQGDSGALATWEEFGRHLSVAMSWTVNIIDPEAVILGGSISEAFKFFGPSTEDHFRKHICPTPARQTKVVCAKLGTNAGFIGAAALALQNS